MTYPSSVLGTDDNDINTLHAYASDYLGDLDSSEPSVQAACLISTGMFADEIAEHGAVAVLDALTAVINAWQTVEFLNSL